MQWQLIKYFSLFSLFTFGCSLLKQEGKSEDCFVYFVERDYFLLTPSGDTSDWFFYNGIKTYEGKTYHSIYHDNYKFFEEFLLRRMKDGVHYYVGRDVLTFPCHPTVGWRTLAQSWNESSGEINTTSEAEIISIDDSLKIGNKHFYGLVCFKISHLKSDRVRYDYYDRKMGHIASRVNDFICHSSLIDVK